MKVKTKEDFNKYSNILCPDCRNTSEQFLYLFTRSMYHLLAIITVLVWGTTFVSTKILLDEGLTPSDIFILRFIIAYIGIALFSHKQWVCNSWRDELMMFVAGLTGGSLYFIGENTSLIYTQAGSVSLLICMAPLLTALFARFLPSEEKSSITLWIGSILAMTGVAFVVNDDSGSTVNPLLGNMLALFSAACWAVYQIIVKPISNRYDVGTLTRKVFGYGLLTMIPYWVYTSPGEITERLTLLREPIVYSNILFLGLMASLMGYWLWNIVVQRLGAVVSSNYIYLNPLVTCIFSYLILGERITVPMIIGGIGILIGIYIAIGLPKPQRQPN